MNMTYVLPLLLNLILFVSAYYVGRRLIDPRWSGGVRFVLWSVVLVMAFSLPVSFIFRRFWLTLGHVWVIQLLQYAMGLYAIVFAMTLLRDVFLMVGGSVERWLARWQKRMTQFQTYADFERQTKRRDFLRESSRWGTFVLTTGTFGRAAVDADTMTPTVVQVDVPIRNLPPALEGVRIVQISDVHVGQLHRERELVAAVVDTVNGLNADVLALTGDMTDGTVGQLRDRLAPLAQMKAKFGRFFVTGNHEYYTEKAENWLAEWSRMGFSTLQNQHAVLTINGASLVIAGVHDLRSSQRHATHVCSPQQALQGAPAAPVILLAHHPDTAKLTDGLPVDLQLSGHTHAGQFFPGTWVVRWVHDFKPGLNLHGANERGWVYVNSGTGYWGPALRSTAVLSEVTLLTLKRA